MNNGLNAGAGTDAVTTPAADDGVTKQQDLAPAGTVAETAATVDELKAGLAAVVAISEQAEPPKDSAPGGQVVKVTSPRLLTGHQVNGVNDELTIVVMDEPGAGGACHDYNVYRGEQGEKDGLLCSIHFQNGPIKEKGVNGLTQEVLLAIVIDRLQCFQAGKYACQENKEALWHIEQAQQRLLNRTRARLARGVEGTSAQ